ncbi:MAG TPA: BACON domain-containing carbohydrate-binding protein [Blastocatellia bacterium]|nr:BACON domain-containing carbohydrate-binding protein [Blastocatellia bacterium]
MKRTVLLSIIAVALSGLLTAYAAYEPALGLTFLVTNINDSGPGSLRQAILDSNASPGGDPNVINFSIGSGVQTISPLSPLPRVSARVIIDGTTQPGYAGKPIIEIEGSQAGSGTGLVISAGFSTVRGLVINRFNGNGIFMFDTNANVIEDNFIGTDVSGSVALGNTGTGVAGSSGIGFHVIRMNVISGNGGEGVSLAIGARNAVEDNFIGTDATGTFALGNAMNGIRASFDTVRARRNVISGNHRDGIWSGGVNQFQGNFVGTDATGTLQLGNFGHGINSAIDEVGGPNAGEGNTIAFNGGAGVFVAVVPTTILSNSIFSNDGLGIDIEGDGVTANDPCDGDSMRLQNYPVLTAVSTMKDSTIIEGTLNSTPNTAFKIEFFSNAAHDPSGFGEGKRLIGSTTVVTDGACNASFTVSLPAAGPGERFFTATATDPDSNTSEFSKAIPALCLNPLSPSSAFFTSMGGEGSVTVTGSAACNWTATSSASWINITSGPSNTGNGIVSYVVRDNLSTSPRQGAIDIGGLTFTVTQEGSVTPSCAYAISPRSAVAEAGGGTGSIAITTSAGCAWEAVSNSSWITITSSCCGVGNGQVTYLVAANASGSGRTGTITVAGKVFNVKQK